MQPLQQSLHFSYLSREGRVAGQVFQFERVARMIEEHRASLAVVPFDVMPAFGADGFAEFLLIARHGERGMAPLRLRIAQQRREAMPFEPRRARQSAEFDERRV